MNLSVWDVLAFATAASIATAVAWPDRPRFPWRRR